MVSDIRAATLQLRPHWTHHRFVSAGGDFGCAGDRRRAGAGRAVFAQALQRVRLGAGLLALMVAALSSACAFEPIGATVRLGDAQANGDADDQGDAVVAADAEVDGGATDDAGDAGIADGEVDDAADADVE